ncbi:MAG: FAD-binding oxidoreductase [Dehalobacterium sp.]
MVSNKLSQDLKNIVGWKNISADRDVISCAGFPEPVRPEIIVFPDSKEEICQIVSYANQNQIEVVPIGGGTQIKAVLCSAGGGVAVSLRRMNRILALEPDNLSLTVEAGLTNDLLQKATEEFNLFLPVFPDHNQSTIGGEVAANAGSRKRAGYGCAGDYVLGVEFISPQGQVVKTGGKTVKNASGYDFTKLLTGSWGTIGVITAVTLRLRPRPEKEAILLVPFKNTEEAVLVGKQILVSRVFPVSLDIFAGRGLEVMTEGAEVILAAGIEGSREAVEEQLQKMTAITGTNTQFINDLAAIRIFWEKYHQFRRNLQSGTVRTAAFDKRILEDMGQALSWIMEDKGAVQLDIASGMIEFSASGVFSHRWAELARHLGKGIKMGSDENLTKQPVLEKLLSKIDPARIMFPHHRLLRGVERG